MSIVQYDLLHDVAVDEFIEPCMSLYKNNYIEEALVLKRAELDIARSKQTFKQRMQVMTILSPYFAITTLAAMLSYSIANLSKELVLKLTEVVTLPVRTATSFLNYFTFGTAYETELKIPLHPFGEDIIRYTHLGMICIFVLSFLLFYGLYQLTSIQEVSFLGCKIKRHRNGKYGMRKTQKNKRQKPLH